MATRLVGPLASKILLTEDQLLGKVTKILHLDVFMRML